MNDVLPFEKPTARDWYDDWCEHHAAVFALPEAGMETLVAWREVFTRNYVHDELFAATNAMVEDAETPPYVDKHRKLLMEQVDAFRRRKAAKASANVPTEIPKGCLFCRGVGIVSVPHPGLDADGRMLTEFRDVDDDPKGNGRCMGVACCCEVGRKTEIQAEDAGRKIMTLTRYENLYPDYRKVQFERQADARKNFPPLPEVGVVEPGKVKEFIMKRLGLTDSEIQGVRS